jgi:hypothetical protein
MINDDTSHWFQIIASQQEQSIYIDLCFTIDGKAFFLIYGYPNYNLFTLDLSKLEFKHILTKEIDNTSISEFHYSFIYNNTVYISLDNSLYTFNPINYNFSKVSDFIGTSRYLPISFIKEGDFYYGLGYSRDSITSQWEFNNDFWKYNINSNQWFKLSPFPGESGDYRLSLGSKNGGYIGCSRDLIKGTYTSDFWYYNPIKNNWTKKASLPCSISSNGSFHTICGFLTNNKVYCYYDKRTYEYNPSFDYWIKLQDLKTQNNIDFPCAFSIENINYIANIMHFNYNEPYYLNLWKFVQ